MSSLQITLRDIPASPVLDALIRKKYDKLTMYYKPITSCHVVVEHTQKHKHQGKIYHVRIDVIVPGKQLVVTQKNHENIYIALRESFNAVMRQLEEHARKRHGRVKTHNHIMHGYVARLIESDGYGFIEGIDGNEYYFSITNVSHPTFDQLMIGDEVKYTPEPTKDGRHAQHVVRQKQVVIH